MRPTPLPPLGLAVAAALLAGVVLVQGLPTLLDWPWWLALSLPALLLWSRAGRLRWIGAALFGIALAGMHGLWALQQRLPDTLANRDLWIEGTVLDLPRHEARLTRFDLRVDSAMGRASSLQGQRLRLSWFRPDYRLQAGERWRMQVRLRAPRGLVNPGGFDFERRALELRLAATGQVRSARSSRRLASARGLDALRERLSAQIEQAVPGGRGRFVQALAVGDTRALTDADWEVLRATGLTHLIAISGFHVGMVAGLAAWLVRWCAGYLPGLCRRWPRPLLAGAAALLAAIVYAGLAGFALPTVRTLLMIAVVVLARLRRRPQRLLDALALALIAVLLVDPLAVLAPGFWLSFLGVAWLMWCLPQRQEAPDVRGFVAAQGVAWLGLGPLTVGFFGQVSWVAPLVNLLGIPWISLGVVPLALLGLLLAVVMPSAAALAWQAAAWLMALLWTPLQIIAAWPGAQHWLPEPGMPALLLAVFGSVWLLLPRGVPGKPLALLLWLPLLWPASVRPDHGEVEVVMFDVGQGLSVLVTTRSHRLLYDAGPASPHGWDAGEATVVPALRALGVTTLDRLLISHGDNDHAGGAAAVMRAFPDVRTFAPEGWAPEPETPASEARPDLQICQREQAWRWDGVDFRILHPPPLMPYQRNESSCVLRIEAGGRVALLTGDIGRHIEARLLKEQAENLRADVLVVPHHGSAGSSTGDFIAAVQPRIALFAVGADNRFGLPKAEVVARYLSAGSDIYDTAGSGAIRLRLGQGGLAAPQRWRVDRPRYWRPAASGPGRSGYAIGPLPEGR